jgi:hypothetical protein
MANNTNETRLIPTYINADYDTALTKFIDLLQEDDTFKDFNYHGSNIAMITQLMSYMADFTNFYTNLVAKNVYVDTADVYETVHRLVKQKGYIPLGYLSSQANVTMTVDNLSPSGVAPSGEINIDGWHTINTGAEDSDGNTIYYTLTERQEISVTADNDDITISDSSVSFELPFRQGTIDERFYTGQDLVDNQIVLPFHDYDNGMYPYDVQAIQVTVNDREWIRVHDFYDHISGLIPDERNVYTFFYDKYQRYAVSFASSFDIPNPSDVIRIRLLRSLGTNGIIGANTVALTTDLEDFGMTYTINNITSDIALTDITQFTNLEASVGGATPEIVRDLKANADANMHTQFRNVTGLDYKFHLEMRSDVIKGTAWGENEVDPGNTIEYNKVYVSCIPRDGNVSSWINGVFETTDITWVDTDTPTLSATIEIPTNYLTSFENQLLRYLEPRKMISVYEFPVIPQGIFFRFDIGIRVNRSYKYTDVLNDVRNKLTYFFDSINREFKEEINFMDIHNFVYDLSITTDDDDFLFIKGLDNLVIRDISTYTVIQAPSGGESLSASLSGGINYHPLGDYITEPDKTTYLENSKISMGTLTVPVTGSYAWTGDYGVFEPNTLNYYPQYTQEAKQNYIDNKLRPIQLGFNQYPMLSIEMCRFFNESI